MQHFPKNCFHFPESSVKFASSTKNEVRKFGEVRSSSSTEILICNPGLLLGDARERSVIIRAIIGDPKEPQRLQMMVRDRFANYVVQRLLDVAEQSQKEEVFWILKDASTVSQLKKTSYGKHILGKLEQIATQVMPNYWSS